MEHVTSPPALRLGNLQVSPPVVLAPMAGVTNVAFRQLCSEQGAGLYVCEMITSRGIVEGDRTSLAMLSFAESETTRSVQLYGIDPAYVGKAVEILAGDHGVDHVDLNFGCPVPKVTRKGGGAALPWKRRLLAEILTSAVKAAEPYGVPVTMKTRKGIDDEHLTYLEAGRIAQEAGCAGVVVGRGCLGRPWLFRDLAAAFAGERVTALPTLGEVAAMMRRHAELLGEHLGEERGCVEFRKHVAWYLKGFSAGSRARSSLGMVSSYAALDDLLSALDPDEPFPVAELGTPRGRQGTPKSSVTLPAGWLDDRDDLVIDAGAEIGVSGG
jgi:tRNA-dihydrouridine synthase